MMKFCKHLSQVAMLWVFILQLSLIPTSQGLQCHQCTYSKLLSTNSLLNAVLDVFNQISDIHCKLAVDADYREIAIRNCPKPKQGYISKCADLNGTVTASFGVIQFDYETAERSCVEVAENDPETTDGCHTDLPASGIARNLLEKTFSGLNLGDITFNGKTCYRTSTVPVPGLQCVRCTWNDVETSNIFLNKVINGLESLSSNNCKLQQIGVDKYNVDLRNCPDAKKGYTTKCANITGKISATKEIVGVDANVQYTTVQRDCIDVPNDGYAYTDGCHSDLPANGPTRALVLETFGTLGLGDIQFDGKACYETTTDTSIASRRTSDSTKLSISHLSIIINTLLLVISTMYLL